MRTNIIQFLFLHIKMHHNAGWLPLQCLGYLTDIKFSLYKNYNRGIKGNKKQLHIVSP